MIRKILFEAQKFILLSLFLFIFLTGNGQNDVITYDSSLNLEIASTGFYRQSILSETSQDRLHFLKMNSNFPHKLDYILSPQKTLQLYSYDYSNSSTDSTTIQFDTLKNFKRDYLLSFSAWGEKIAFLVNQNLLIYNLKDSTLSKHNLNYDYEKIKFVNDSLLIMHTLYNYNDRDQKEKVILTNYNINTHQSNSIFPQFHNIEFSVLPGNWISVSSSSILMSQSTEYKIIEYDFNLNIKQIIIDSTTTITPTKKTQINSKNDFETLRNLDDSVERIVNIFLLTDTTFAILRKTPSGQDSIRLLDLWHTGESTRKVGSHIIPIKSVKNLDYISKRNLPLNFLLLNTNFYSLGESIYELRVQYYPLMMNVSKIEYLKTLKDYRNNNLPTIGIKKYETHF